MTFVKPSFQRLSALLVALMVGAACAGQGTSNAGSGQAGSVVQAGKVYSLKDIQQCSNPSSDLKLGAIFENSGNLAYLGGLNTKGVQLAIQQVTARGGVDVGGKCYKISLNLQDDRSDTAAAVAAAQGLIRDSGIKFVFGPTSGLVAAKTAEITQASDPPAIEISPTIVWLSNGLQGKHQYRGLFSTSEASSLAVAGFMSGIGQLMPSVKKLALAFQQDSVGDVMVQNIQTAAAKSGLTIVATERFAPGSTDFSAVLTRISTTKPDLLFVGWDPTAELSITRQAVELKAAPALMSYGSPITFATKDAVNGPLPVPFLATYLYPSLAANPSQNLKDLADLYQKTYNADPNAQNVIYFTTMYFDAVSMLVKAVQLSKSVDDVNAIQKNLAGLHWNGVLGADLCWDSSQSIVYGPLVALVNNGSVTWKKVPTPPGACKS